MTTHALQLGQREFDHKGNEYLFVRVTTIFGLGPGQAAAVNEENIAERANDQVKGEDGDRVGIAMSRLDGDPGFDQYGWVSIYGVGMIQARQNTAANQHIYTSSGGRIGDVSTGQERIFKIVLTTARGGGNGLAPAVWYYPHY